MLVMQITVLLFVAAAGTAVVLTRDPRSQVIGISFYGVLLGVMFFIFQAPDVALSQIAVGAVALPLMVMLALTKIRIASEDREEQRKKEESKKKHSEEAA